jgi:hypothetical protein
MLHPNRPGYWRGGQAVPGPNWGILFKSSRPALSPAEVCFTEYRFVEPWLNPT